MSKRERIDKLEAQVKVLTYRVDTLERLCNPTPVCAEITLGQPQFHEKEIPMKVQLNFKKGTKQASDLQFPQLASDGATLTAFDAAGNPTTIDPTKTSVAWSTSDSSVLTIAVSPTDQTQATVKSTGKIGTGITIMATFTNLDGSTPMPPAVSVGIDVPAGAPVSATITLGIPA